MPITMTTERLEFLRQATKEHAVGLTRAALTDLLDEVDAYARYIPVPECATCIHWDNLISENKFYGACRLYEHDPHSPASFSSLVTTATFGCVCWREK